MSQLRLSAPGPGPGPRPGEGERPSAGRRRPAPAVRRCAEPLALAGPVAALAVLGWAHRWAADDGLIYTRVVRQILAGHGPVSNPGERAEAGTGTLWQWLVAGVDGPIGVDPALLAVVLGLVCSAAGLLAALDGTRLLYRASTGAPLLPLGALVPPALAVEWDFATSGLENGLSTLWIGLCWRVLVRCPAPERPAPAPPAPAAPPAARVAGGAVLFGLGPLVRPDLALVTGVFAVAWWLAARPGRRRTLAAAGCALALPAGYELFRAGYYGILVPLPALAKDAGGSVWPRGLAYLGNLAGPYWLWVPGLLIAGWALYAARGLRGRSGPRGVRGRRVAVVAAPPAAGLASALYVCRVGGDFMHGRMLLEALLLVLLPVLLVPANRVSAAVAAAVAVWALGCGLWLRPPASSGRPYEVVDEHAFYLRVLSQPHPDSLGSRRSVDPGLRADLAAARRSGRPVLLLQPDHGSVYRALRLDPRRPGRIALADAVLGESGYLVPLDGTSIDPLGLSYPLAAHQAAGPVGSAGRAGHSRRIAAAWIAADYGDPAGPAPRGVDPRAVDAARAALRCGPLAELQRSVRAPLTPSRFWRNLTGAWRRTLFRYPADPFAAERELCRTR